MVLARGMVAWTMGIAKEAVKNNQILDLFWRRNHRDFLIGLMCRRTVRDDGRVFDLSRGRMEWPSTGGEDCGW